MVLASAAAIGMALSSWRLAPALAEASPAPRRALALSGPTIALPTLPDARSFIARNLITATLIAAAGIAVVVVAATAATMTARLRDNSPTAPLPTYGPPATLRASARAAMTFEQAHSSAFPSADALAGAIFAAAQERYAWEVLRAMKQLDEQRQAQATAAAAPARPSSLNRASGYAVGTILTARITIYGCVGPGGGFCNNMASGMPVFEGAAACSPDLPFGTKVRIQGDPTGRVYECLDRGALAATWIDVFFYDTQAGMAWQSLLGGTVAQIEIVN